MIEDLDHEEDEDVEEDKIRRSKHRYLQTEDEEV